MDATSKLPSGAGERLHLWWPILRVWPKVAF